MLGSAQAMYLVENDDQYAGVNTSGAAYQGIGLGTTGVTAFSDALIGEISAATPTSSWDWISPILGEKASLTDSRADRLAEILNRVACPEATRNNDAVYSSDDVADGADFERVVAAGVRQVSYLQAASFQFYSANADLAFIPDSGPPGGDFFLRSPLHQGFASPVVTRSDFRPVLHAIGTSPSQKIIHADGTRYLAQGDQLELEASLDTRFYGNFGTSGPTFDGSAAYGREFLGDPGNIDLSFRHKGGMNATMFDGSVRWLSREEAWTDPTPWYPSGSVFTGEGATPESVEFVENNFAGSVLP